MTSRLCVFVMGVYLLVAGVAGAATGATQRLASPATDRPEVVVEPVKELTMLQLLQKGGPVMYPLYLCSILMVAFAIERAINLRRKKILPRAVVDKLNQAIRQEGGLVDTTSLLNEFKDQDNPLARIVTTGLRRADRPLAEVEKAIEDTGEKEADLLRRNCRVLSLVATIAPLLGLLGTVTGMVRAFMTVAARQEALGRTELLAAGIYEALVTTVVGLVIAIPSIVLYHFYVDRVHRLVGEIDSITTKLVEAMPVSRKDG